MKWGQGGAILGQRALQPFFAACLLFLLLLTRPHLPCPLLPTQPPFHLGHHLPTPLPAVWEKGNSFPSSRDAHVIQATGKIL